jgi:hypothetical protein
VSPTGNLAEINGSLPVAGRPRLLGITFIDFTMVIGITLNHAEGKEEFRPVPPT